MVEGEPRLRLPQPRDRLRILLPDTPRELPLQRNLGAVHRTSSNENLNESVQAISVSKRKEAREDEE
jgi:hypothetical protein